MSCSDDRFKNFRNKKKTNPRIVCDDICRYIANNSERGLTREQVRECFRLYHKMLGELYVSPYADKDMTVILPHIGYFYLKNRTGRKGGSTYKLFDEDVVLDKSEPSFFQIRFKFYKLLYDKIKDKTKYYE